MGRIERGDEDRITELNADSDIHLIIEGNGELMDEEAATLKEQTMDLS